MIITFTCVKNVYKKKASEIIVNLDKYYVNIMKSIKTKIKISNMRKFQHFFFSYGETKTLTLIWKVPKPQK